MMKGLIKILTTLVLSMTALVAFAQGPGDDSREVVQFDVTNMEPQTIRIVKPAPGFTKDQPIKMTSTSLEPTTTKVQVNSGQVPEMKPATIIPGKNGEPVSGRVVREPKK